MARRRKTAKYCKPKTVFRLLDLEQVEKGGVESACDSEFRGIIPSCGRRVHWLVLLGATFGVQPVSCASVPVLLGTEGSASVPHQCALGRSAATCFRSCRRGAPEPELAAGIRRVKGAKRLGVRIGNWLTVDQTGTLLEKASLPESSKNCNGPLKIRLLARPHVHC